MRLPRAGYYERHNEPLCSIRHRDFLEHMSNLQFLRRNSVPSCRSSAVVFMAMLNTEAEAMLAIWAMAAGWTASKGL
jgi:hypothetical protein